MKLSATLISIITVASAVFAHPSSKQAVFVAYANGYTKVYDFGECIHVALQPGNIRATRAITLQSVTCSAQGGFNCEDGPKPPQSVPVPAGAPLPNVVNVAELVAQGVKCYQNTLPAIP